METQESFQLSDSVRNFILHWGEMGSRWGINRTMAQIHALLYISPHPLHAEEISESLSLARSTVSTSLRELQNWGVIRMVHVLGDRRDHYEAIDDVWEMFRMVLDERKRREVDPTLEILREGVEQAEEEGQHEGGEHTYKKLKEMLEFFEAMSRIYDRTKSVPTKVLKRVAQPDRLTDIIKLGKSDV
ncbi:MAG: GbsR/MarR family transcriptional regulator [Anaerolineales bacterium]